jgi:cytochrome c1
VLGLVLAACSFGPPNSIDVSSYPADMQGRYTLFAHKCSRCHSLERPLQAHVGANGWGDYVRRMSRHPGAGISDDEQREIATFLQYHSKREAERRK